MITYVTSQAGEAALLQLGFDNVQACKLSIGTDICSYGVHFAEERMREVTKLGWKECDVRWHTWRDFDNFQTLWPLMDPLNDLNALQEMLGSLGVDSKVASLHCQGIFACSSPSR